MITADELTALWASQQVATPATPIERLIRHSLGRDLARVRETLVEQAEAAGGELVLPWAGGVSIGVVSETGLEARRRAEEEARNARAARRRRRRR